jgi:hypothetical protein
MSRRPRRELDATLCYGTAAGDEFFELVKKSWRLPYRCSVLDGETVCVAGKRVATYRAQGEGRNPKADPMAKGNPEIPGPSACQTPFGV